MGTQRWWIVGHDDKAWGPFEKAPLADMVAEGKLRTDGLVCAEGEAHWSPIGSRPELAEIQWPPVFRAPAQRQASAAPGPFALAAPSADPASLRLNELDPIPGWATVLLSIPTLGLWGAFNFYKTMRVYRRLAGNPTSNVETLFWVLLALIVLGIVALPIFVGWLLLVAAVVVGGLLIRESLRLRDLAILRLVPQAASMPAQYPAVKSDDWHFGLWVTGSVLCISVVFAIVGVPILIAQALAWFEDWNAISAIARGSASTPNALPT